EVPALQFPVFVHRNRQNDEALRERVRLMAEETGAQAFLRQQQAIMTRADARPFLPAIKCPTLVLVGDGDELTPPALSQEIAAGVAGSRLVVVADCGHLSTMERPDAVNRALVEWMTGCRPSVPSSAASSRSPHDPRDCGGKCGALLPSQRPRISLRSSGVRRCPVVGRAML